MIETKNFILRSMNDEDKYDFYEIFKSDEVGKFVNKMSMEQVERYFEKRKTKPVNPYSFVAVLNEEVNKETLQKYLLTIKKLIF